MYILSQKVVRCRGQWFVLILQSTNRVIENERYYKKKCIIILLYYYLIYIIYLNIYFIHNIVTRYRSRVDLICHLLHNSLMYKK